MSDTKADIVQSSGVRVARGYSALNFKDGLRASVSQGVVSVDNDPEYVETRRVAALTPDDAEGAGVNVIEPHIEVVRLGANVNGVNDFVVLPALADVPNGHKVTIIAGAADCEVRTPATSAEEINSEDCDGTKEYLLTATQIHEFIKIDSTIGWMGHGYSAIGAVVTAVVPDA